MRLCDPTLMRNWFGEGMWGRCEGTAWLHIAWTAGGTVQQLPPKASGRLPPGHCSFDSTFSLTHSGSKYYYVSPCEALRASCQWFNILIMRKRCPSASTTHKPHERHTPFFFFELRMTKFDRTRTVIRLAAKPIFQLSQAQAKLYFICRPCIVALFSITVKHQCRPQVGLLALFRACQPNKAPGLVVNVKFGTHSGILQLQMDTPLGVLYGGWAHRQLQTQISSKSTRPKLLRFPFV